MTTTINADTSTGGAVISGDASGVLGLQAAGSTQVTINGSGVVLANPLPVGSGGTGATSLSGITAGSATNLAGGSAGTVPYQSATGTTAMLAAGTSGYLLQSNGAAAPSWTAPPSSAMTLISTQNPSNAASVSWTGLSGYSTYMLVVNTTLPYANSGQLLCMDFGVGATPTYISANYTYAKVYNPGYSSATGDGSGSASNIILVRPSAGSSSRPLSGSFTITTAVSAQTGTPNAYVMGTAFQASSTAINATGGWVDLGAALTAIRLYYDGDNIGSGKFSLYGIST